MLVALCLVIAAFIVFSIRRVFLVPKHLSHIPSAPILPLLKSYFSGEVEEQRIRRIVLPFANIHGFPMVLVWTFGLWRVHILESKLGKSTLENRVYHRQLPPQNMIFWRFSGRSNIFFTEGEEWKKHSRLLNNALQGSPPVEDFVRLSRKLFQQMGKGGEAIKWDSFTHRFTLDVVGIAILGYDFKAIEEPDSPFVNGYRRTLASMTAPPYIFIPQLEKIFPRHQVEQDMYDLRDKFSEIIAHKKNNYGDDIISCMLQDPEFGEQDYVDNVVVLFIAGHDTTAGALSSLVYFLAKYPEHQAKAREEVLSVIGDSDDPTTQNLSRMPYVLACIKESMRLNNPSNGSLPRIASIATQVGPHLIPPNTPLIFDIAAIHRNKDSWPETEEFNPQRFVGEDALTDNTAWVSFGAGPRHCPARNFSLWEQRTLAALLLREYEWTLPESSIHFNGIKNAFSFSALNVPHDLDIIFNKRISS